MKTIWDLTEKEVASLTEEQVSHYCDIHLMQKGVLIPEHPGVNPKHEFKNNLKKEIAYVLDDNYSRSVAFKTHDEAIKLLREIEIYETEYVYIFNTSYYFLKKLDRKIKPIEVYNELELKELKSKTSKIETEQKEYDQKYKEYEEALQKKDSIIEEVWSYYYECQRKEKSYKKIIDTFEKYKGLANDDTTAFTFLKEAFSEEDINEAFKYFVIERK